MKKVLIVEDEELIGELLQRKLQSEGFYAFLARDGQEALEKSEKDRPHLILLDLVLPGLNGFELLEELKKREETKEIPVVIISNSGQPMEIERAKKAGVVDWLVKTEFDPKEVVAKVEKLIGPGQHG